MEKETRQFITKKQRLGKERKDNTIASRYDSSSLSAKRGYHFSTTTLDGWGVIAVRSKKKGGGESSALFRVPEGLDYVCRKGEFGPLIAEEKGDFELTVLYKSIALTTSNEIHGRITVIISRGKVLVVYGTDCIVYPAFSPAVTTAMASSQ